MSKSALISARIDPALKENTENILKQLGLTPSQAITLFYHQVTLYQGLPFPVSLPNARTRRALQEVQVRKNLKTFDNVEALFKDIEG